MCLQVCFMDRDLLHVLEGSVHDPGYREATAVWWKLGHLAHRTELLI